MADLAFTPVFRYLTADYLNLGTPEAPQYEVMTTFENVDESPSAQTVEKHYTCNANASTITTGYKTQFPITTDLYQNEKVTNFIRDIGEEQKLGTQTEYVRVRLYQPIEGKDSTYYARKFLVGFEISSISGGGGEIVSISGNMNAIGQMEIGEFNTKTRIFTPKEEASAPEAEKALLSKK